MDILESCITEELLSASSLGKIVRVIPGNTCVFLLSDLNPRTIEGLWVSLVLSLTKKGLVRGILDVPMKRCDDGGVIFVKGFRVLCIGATTCDYSSWLKESQPILPPALTLAIGGPAGAGKTTLIRSLAASKIGRPIIQYIAHTTRPRRDYEVDGTDYHFVNPTDLESYRADPRFTGFVEARGNWYWIDPSILFRERWAKTGAIHVFAITQVNEFFARRALAPDLRWIWLDASPEVLEHRLRDRGDNNITRSLEQNQRLATQDRTGLISLHLSTEIESVDDSLRRLLAYIENSWEEQK